ncbi:MAG: MFS transporter [Tumebacillaceae bacterium]
MVRLVAILFSAGIVGLCQGFIVPLLALLLEQRGVSPLLNGISTMAMYLGVIIASPFVERAVRRVGAKRTISYSTCFCIAMTLLFPLWDNYAVWIVVRLLLGVGLSGLYVATEIWLNQILTSANRGRVLAFYGLFITIGMLVGPQGINLLDLSPSAPFLICAACYLLPLVITSRVDDGDVRLEPLHEGETTGMKRWWRLFSFAPFAMGAAFVYGFLDGALNGSFPIFGARIGMGVSTISLALSVFMFGCIVFQFPLGMLSDRWGRRPALILASLIGLFGFLLLPFGENSVVLVMVALFIAGGALGSFYSLGLAFLGDLLEGADLPTGNVFYTMLYGAGSLLGPSVTGWLISFLGRDAFAWSVVGMLVCYGGFGLLELRKISKEKIVNASGGV